MYCRRFFTLNVKLLYSTTLQTRPVEAPSLAQLALNNLLPVSLATIHRTNRFIESVSMPIVSFKRPSEPTTLAIELPWRMTSCPLRPDLFHWAVVYYRAGLRKGTAAVKNRGRVSGGGRKLYKQKGTGRARAGSSRAPQRRGGGVCFGPRPRDFSQKLPRKIRGKALLSALAMKYRTNRLRIITSESLSIDSYKTLQLVPILEEHVGEDSKSTKKILIVDAADFPNNLVLASRRIAFPATVCLFNCADRELSCHTVLDCSHLLITPRAIEQLLSKFS